MNFKYLKFALILVCFYTSFSNSSYTGYGKHVDEDVDSSSSSYGGYTGYEQYEEQMKNYAKRQRIAEIENRAPSTEKIREATGLPKDLSDAVASYYTGWGY